MESTSCSSNFTPSAEFNVKRAKKPVVHRATQIFKASNIAIATAYFSIGLAMSFISTPLNIYMVEYLNAEPPMQSTIGILQTLPWSMKLVFGFVSDVVPICGLHRKPYLTLGSVLYSGAFIFYALIGVDDTILLAITIFVGTLGLIMMDVMCDTMCVERTRFEDEAIRGQMQSTYYSIRFAGGLLGSFAGALLCNSKQWGWGLTFQQTSLVNGIIPFILVSPWLFSLREKYQKVSAGSHPITVEVSSHGYTSMGSHGHLIELVAIDEEMNPTPRQKFFMEDEDSEPLVPTESTKLIRRRMTDILFPEDESPKSQLMIQMNEIWETVQLTAVWRPMAFVYVFNLFQVPNVAWQSYLQLTLHFEPWVLGAMVCVGSFMTFCGVLAYKYLFFKTSWRKIYLWSVCLTTFFSLLQICLILQINKTVFHLSNYAFSLGDDIITAYIAGIQFLPGAEGTSYSMLTTFGNIAMVCSVNVGNMLSGIWDVSNEAMRHGEVGGLWRLNLLTASLSVMPLVLLPLLPKSEEDQERLSKDKSKSRLGGIVFLTVLVASVLWTFVVSFWRLFASMQ